MNEEALNDENDVEEEEGQEDDIEGNITKDSSYDDSTEKMDAEHDYEIAHEPAEVVIFSFHAHDIHTLSNFGLFLGEHDGSLS